MASSIHQTLALRYRPVLLAAWQQHRNGRSRYFVPQVLGLSTLLLLGMTATIQLFIYPDAWPTHIQWLAFMAVIVLRGPGRLSLDALIGPRLIGPSAEV